MTTDTTTSATPPVETSFSYPHPENYKDGPYKLKRNEYGLLENIDYKFDENGFVSWREMINPKFLYPNKGWFERAKMEVPASIEGLEDHQLLCKLGGYKELARLRGYSSVKYKLEYLPNGVSATCTIEWFPNFETRQKLLPQGQWAEGTQPYYDNTIVKFQSIANSTSENCGDFMASLKETQAENRAFVRCVRNFLNINIIGDDEISRGKNILHEEQDNAPNAYDPNYTLEQHAKKKYKNWAEFRNFLIQSKYKKSEEKVWNGYADIPVTDCRKLIEILTA
jgi:hypothetical protein